jgi:acetyl-CoA/propionyl-CoA carboxylase, biotin carboxylase, biotin carboxyl carrier protein
MKITFDDTTIDLTKTGKSYRATMGEETVEVEIIHAEAERGQLELLINGEHLAAYVSSDNAKRWVTINGRTFVLTKQTGSRKSGGGHHHTAGELTAPMPGQVRAVNISEGDDVTKGQTLFVLEAMKMEIRIQSPQDGTVNRLLVKQGQTVEREQILVEIVDRLAS